MNYEFQNGDKRSVAELVFAVTGRRVDDSFTLPAIARIDMATLAAAGFSDEEAARLVAAVELGRRAYRRENSVIE